MPLFDMKKVSRDDPAYKACLAGSVAAGAIVGTQVGGAGAPLTMGSSLVAGPLAGAAWGFVAGYLSCPYLVPKVRKKLQDGTELSEEDLVSAVEAMGQYSHTKDVKQALRLTALARSMAPASTEGSCSAPPSTANQIRTALKTKKKSVFAT